MPDITAAPTLQEQRIRHFDEIIQGCRLILETCGRSKFMDSIFVLWSQVSQALFLLERTLWPEQRPDTPLHLALPTEPRPLGDLLLDAFMPNAQYIFNAMRSLDTFHTWFAGSYNVGLHSDFNVILVDASLIFRSIETMLRLQQRLIANAPRAAPIDLGPPDPSATSTTDAAPTTASADTAVVENPMELQGDTGAPLQQWF